MNIKEFFEMIKITPIFPYESCTECNGLGYVDFGDICSNCNGSGLYKFDK